MPNTLRKPEQDPLRHLYRIHPKIWAMRDQIYRRSQPLPGSDSHSAGGSSGLETMPITHFLSVIRGLREQVVCQPDLASFLPLLPDRPGAMPLRPRLHHWQTR
jgi:hypothetical protein